MHEKLPVDVSRESLEQLSIYVETLLHWQKRINLIGPSTARDVWQRHVADSLQVLPLIPRGVSSIADLGAGAGFPGLVLAIAGGYEAHLYESNGKKAAFMGDVIRKTGANAHVHNVRIETLKDTSSLPDCQLVVSRAFAPLPELLDYAEPFLLRGATAVFHKGQDIDAELTAATKCWKIKSTKHPSSIDSRGVLLEIEEAFRVATRE